jgi:hypothetical protein
VLQEESDGHCIKRRGSEVVAGFPKFFEGEETPVKVEEAAKSLLELFPVVGDEGGV